MQPFHGNIEQLTLENNFFRKVIYTGPHSQLVLMCLQPNEEIGSEVHDKEDQFIRVEKGTAKAVIAGEEYELAEDMAIIVPAGTQHNVINMSGSSVLQLYTIYSPAHHAEGTVHETKAIADEAEAHEH